MNRSKKTYLLILVMFSLSFSYFTVEAEGGEKIFQYPINVGVLENGLKVVSVEFDSPGLISYYTIVRTGSRNEVEAGKSGFAHFFEHIMFR